MVQKITPPPVKSYYNDPTAFAKKIGKVYFTDVGEKAGRAGAWLFCP
jgi:hypothetical protein